jgi:hypothetical protein
VKRLELLNCCIPQGAYLLLRPADQVLYEVRPLPSATCSPLSPLSLYEVRPLRSATCAPTN